MTRDKRKEVRILRELDASRSLWSITKPIIRFTIYLASHMFSKEVLGYVAFALEILLTNHSSANDIRIEENRLTKISTVVPSTA